MEQSVITLVIISNAEFVIDERLNLKLFCNINLFAYSVAICCSHSTMQFSLCYNKYRYLQTINIISMCLPA